MAGEVLGGDDGRDLGKGKRQALSAIRSRAYPAAAWVLPVLTDAVGRQVRPDPAATVLPSSKEARPPFPGDQALTCTYLVLNLPPHPGLLKSRLTRQNCTAGAAAAATSRSRLVQH